MKAFFKAGPLFIALFLCFGYLCHTSHAGALEPQDKELSVAQLTRAKQLFKERCARCHGADGRGQTVIGGMLDVPDFTDKARWKDDVEDERLIESVRNGKGGMPKFGKKLTGQQIALLVTYVRRFHTSKKRRSLRNPLRPGLWALAISHHGRPFRGANYSLVQF